MVNDSRISAGKEFINQQRGLKTRRKYIWNSCGNNSLVIGIETRYGRIKGNIRVIDSLSTLAFDYPRRAKFFKTQLEEFLLLREKKTLILLLEGSIAGAMGYGQFMPDSYRNYVDFDKDGIGDILNNPVDAIGSVANYLIKRKMET